MIGPLVFVLAFAGLGPSLLPVLVATTLMFAVGLADDLRTFRPATKLVLQMAVAAVFLSLAPALHRHLCWICVNLIPSRLLQWRDAFTTAAPTLNPLLIS